MNRHRLVTLVGHRCLATSHQTSLLLLFVLWNVAWSSQVVAQTERDKPSNRSSSEPSKSKQVDNVTSIDCQGIIERRRADLTSKHFSAAEISLPALEGGKKYRLNVTMVNPYDAPIQFSTVSVSCGCAKFETETNEIPALGSATFVIHLDVPNQVVNGRSAQMLRFSGLDPADQVLTIRFEYDVNNVFSFVQNRVIIEIPKSESIVVAKLPVTLVPPMTIDKLELHVSENLRDLSIQLVGDDPDSAVPYVKVEAPRHATPQSGIMGDVYLRRPGTDHETGVVISIKHQDSFTLRPESLRLSRDNHSKPYEATAMLRVHAVAAPERIPNRDYTETKEGGNIEAIAVPQVGLTIGGATARVLVKQLGQSGIYRLTIRYDGLPPEKSDETLEVRWKVIVNGEEQVIESHAFLPNR